MDPDQTAPSDLVQHCSPVCKNRFEKFARIFSRRHKQTTFSDAGFLGALKINLYYGPYLKEIPVFDANSVDIDQTPRFAALIWVYIVC